MKKKFKLMNSLFLSSMIFSLSFGGVVQAEESAPETANLITSQVSVNDARAKTEQIVLEKNEGATLASSDTETTTDIMNTEDDSTPQEDTPTESTLPVENESLENPPPVENENTDVGVDKTEEVTTPEEEVEIPSETDEEVTNPDPETDNKTPMDEETHIKDLDNSIKEGLKPIEEPESTQPVENIEDNDSYYETGTETIEENSVVSENTVTQDENKTAEKKPEQSSKVKKSNLERLPETGIAENIEMIYIFEIIILGFALILLSFKPKQKARSKK